jgi:hypothetical protein
MIDAKILKISSIDKKILFKVVLNGTNFIK